MYENKIQNPFEVLDHEILYLDSFEDFKNALK